MYIGDYLGRRAIYSPAKPAVFDSGKDPGLRLTFSQMNDRANKLANWLREQARINAGDRVAILARDGVEHLDTFFACSKIGAIHTAYNWRLHWREIAAISAGCQPKVLIYSGEFSQAVDSLKADRGGTSIQYYIYLDSLGSARDLKFDELLAESAATPIFNEEVDDETIAALIFTGGTTGLPKAAQVSHRMIAWNTLNTIIHDLHHDDVYLNVFPLFHTGGLFVYTLPQVILGGQTILIRQFDPQETLELIEQEEVTVFAGVPAMYQMITQAPNWETADLSSLRFCTSGGAPLPVPLVEKYTAEKGIRFKQGFGMTEFGPGLFALAPEDAIRKAGSIGRPNFFVDARIVDDQNQPLGPNETGELILKGRSGSSGYYKNPQASSEAVDNRGWFHTGDLARFDPEWYFTIVDRKKDMFISGGENIYPVEIEKVIYQHPAVHMCAIVGVPDKKWGETGLACVVLKPESQLTAASLREYLEQNLAKFKIPKHIQFMDSLPISAAGKILKRELRSDFVP